MTTLANSSLANCKSLTSLYIPDSVTYLGEWALSNCTSLTSVRLPAGITTLPIEYAAPGRTP